MLRFAPYLAIAFLLGPVPLVAEDNPAPLRDCRALLKAVQSEVTRTPETTAEAVPGGCRFTHVGYLLEGMIEYRADAVTLLTPQLLATFPTEAVFKSADLSIQGLRILPRTGNAMSDYLTSHYSKPINIELVYDTDPATLTAQLKRFSFDAGDIGRLTLFARFSNFDNTDIDYTGLGNEMGVLHELGLAIEDNGLLASYVLPLLLSGFSYDEDPRPVLAAQKIAVSTAIRALPESLLSSVSAESLVRFVTAFPLAHGNWTLHFESEKGLPLSALDASSLDDFAALLASDARITATADYRPD